jgi:hypothetical protein
MARQTCLHFVGVKYPALWTSAGYDPRYDYMVRFFGIPDFVHVWWDIRAQKEIETGDTVIFADGNTLVSPVRPYSFDDSAFQ